MSIPDFEPMMATRVEDPFDDPGWWFELKWDGYRAVLAADRGRIRARSRRGLDLTGPFPELAQLPLPDGVAVDGEVFGHGRSDGGWIGIMAARTPHRAHRTGRGRMAETDVIGVLLIGGRSGAGKSTVGYEVSELLRRRDVAHDRFRGRVHP